MNGDYIKKATKADVPTIRQLAVAIWWPTYQDYLPHGQIRLMLENSYAEHALVKQLENGHLFLLVYRAGTPVGFVGFGSLERLGTRVIRIEKLYILPSEQGTGLGKLLLDEVGKYACAYGASYVELYVNRNNPAKALLNDYIMQKTVTP